MILPGATLGMLGGGQLGRMFTVAARTMGYRVIVLDPDPDSPAGRIADEHLHASFTDRWALDQLGASCAAVSTEFENIPAKALRVLEAQTIVRPAARVLEVTQNRIREKTFLRQAGFSTAAFAVVEDESGLAQAMAGIAGPAILKRADFGYDGKGQVPCDSLEQAREAFLEMGSVACVLEERIDLAVELSAIIARSSGGEIVCYPVAENVHSGGILDTTLIPARVGPELNRAVEDMAGGIAEALNCCGVMAVEFFVDETGRVLVNEIAPRPHNSGHYTLDACVTSQFEQQVRMICDLPAGSIALHSPIVMVNLLGELWARGTPPWGELLADPCLKLHLYGKRTARPGRKMGHFSVLDQDLEVARQRAEDLKNRLQSYAQAAEQQ
jgi:5-(carboxyamino)imidazole ribonucleotide synthase